jgi:cation channel sperm-associated protein 2
MKVIDPVWAELYVISWVWLGAFVFRNIFIGVMGKRSFLRLIIVTWTLTQCMDLLVNNFDKISDTLKEQEAEHIKMKQFEKMRRKLNKELAVQGNIQRSMSVLQLP